MKMKAITLLVLITSGLLFAACGYESARSTAESNNAAPGAQTPAANKEANKPEGKPTEEIQKAQQVFDGREFKEEGTKPSPAAAALIEKEVRLRAKEEFLQKRLGELEKNEPNEENFSVKAVVEGSFTKPASKQKAYLYRYSYTNGVVVIEDEKIVAHYSGDPGDYALYIAIGSLPDVDRDGLSEIVLYRTVEDNEDIYAYLFKAGKDGMELIGEATVYSSDYLAGEDQKKEDVEQRAFKLTVEPGAKPVFFRESFKKKGAAKWAQAGKLEKFALEKRSDASLARIDK